MALNWVAVQSYFISFFYRDPVVFLENVVLCCLVHADKPSWKAWTQQYEVIFLKKKALLRRRPPGTDIYLNSGPCLNSRYVQTEQ